MPSTAHPKKKRGPAKKLPPMVDTHVYVPEDLLEWAKNHEEGFAPLVRRLLARERDLLRQKHSSRDHQ